MGTALSSEAVENNDWSSTFEQFRKKLCLAMDPRLVLEELTPDANLDIIYSNLYADQRSSGNSLSEIVSSEENGVSSVSVEFDDTSLDDNVGNVAQAIASSSSDRNSSSRVVAEQEPQDPIDVYMSRIVPPGLVRMMSSSSSVADNGASKEDSQLCLDPEYSPSESV